MSEEGPVGVTVEVVNDALLRFTFDREITFYDGDILSIDYQIEFVGPGKVAVKEARFQKIEVEQVVSDE